MEFGQNRNNTRGPLIAVIKIQIDSQRTDRIFLHQRDNDLRLAQLFVEKHGLSSTLIQHIYQRIKFSRESVEQNEEQILTPHARSQSAYHPYSNSNYKIQTPINHLGSQKKPLNQQQSFGTSNQISDRMNNNFEEPLKNTGYFDDQEELFSEDRKETFKKAEQRCLQAPSKWSVLKNKQFMLYDKQNEENERIDVNLFDSKQNINQSQQIKLLSASERQQQNSQNKQPPIRMRNVLEIIKQQEKENTALRGSKSMMKLKAQEALPVQVFKTTSKQLPKYDRSSELLKPSHVKIIKKEEMESLNQSLKKSMSKQEISRINKDVTRRLYNEADLKKNYLLIIKEKAKKDKQKEAEDAELTHKPQINKISKVIAEGRKKIDVPIEDYLIEEGKKAENKRNQCNSKKMMKELQECSFKPQLNIISQKLAADKEGIESRLKESKRSCFKDQTTFRPSLNQITKQLMKGKGTFEERQKLYLECKNEKLMDLVHERLLGQKIDLRTGQELYKPIINDLGIRQSQGPNIGSYLYDLSKDKPELIENKSIKPRISQTSQNIVQQMNMKRIAWLFSELDSDQDGVISPQKICIDSISPELLSIIKPILFEMEQISQELTLQQFKNAVDILHKKLNVNQKCILYNYRQKCK